MSKSLKEQVNFIIRKIWYNPRDPQKVYLEGMIFKLEEITQLEFLEIL